METSRDIINEELSSDYNGLTVYDDLLKLSVEKAKFNDLMEINVSGSTTLRMKSAETLKSHYEEKDWNQIVKQFEKDLNSIISNMESELKKF